LGDSFALVDDDVVVAVIVDGDGDG